MSGKLDLIGVGSLFSIYEILYTMVNTLNNNKKGLDNFHKTFPKNGIVYIEDSVLWYCIDWDLNWYLGLDINDRINFKQSFFN